MRLNGLTSVHWHTTALLVNTGSLKYTPQGSVVNRTDIPFSPSQPWYRTSSPQLGHFIEGETRYFEVELGLFRE